MNAPPPRGWDDSAVAWIAEIGEEGDYGRRFVLDAPMIERVRRQPFRTALDVGCGEGRFCRMMQAEGLRTVGVDPTQALIDRAKQLNPGGDSRLCPPQPLPSPDTLFDLIS